MTKLTTLKGIGEKSEKALNARGIFSLEDLTKITPSKFYALGEVRPFESDQKAILIEGTIVDEPKLTFIKGMSFVKAKVKDTKSEQVFSAKWFNQPYMKKNIKQCETYRFFGNTKKTEMHVILCKTKAKAEELDKFFPIYKKFGIKRNILQASIEKAQQLCGISSVFSEKIEKKHKLMAAKQAFSLIHNPKTKTELEQAEKRINVEKSVELLLNERKNMVLSQKERKGFGIDPAETNEYEKMLPFKLTTSQKKVLFEIICDLNSNENLNRLVQGDVGSGKTVVAFIAALLIINSKYTKQVALMAPTEILARQHFDTFNKFFKNTTKVQFLSSSLSKDEIASIKDSVKTGETKFLIGTHMLADSVEFKNLGLVIIDEQHRFGVETRAKLVNKCQTGDSLLLSATPIPRSVKLTKLKNLKLSQIEERPMANNIKTFIIQENKENDMWDFVFKQNGKVFVVCPRIEENDDPFEEETIASTKEMKKFLEKKFPTEKVLEIDGKKKFEETSSNLKKFQNENNKFVVATTIIEVGIDIPEASIVVIKNPEQFGLATLHQIRGRVGRDGKEAFCFLLMKNKSQAETRLRFFQKNNNGFDIADFDFKTRGAGDIFGTAQHGGIEQIELKEFEIAEKIVEEIGIENKKTRLISNN